ncbi:MAG: helix-turn-helix transcriptional regulator [Akkermansia sp.]|mgnify:CR=1 FL=1|nr:helix-turn-helix transcriptional regulator [Akkermansia sp.]
MHPDSIILKRIGEQLKALRKERKLTQQQLSELCRVHRKFISLVERGMHNISVLTLCQIINALGKDFSSFMVNLEREAGK